MPTARTTRTASAAALLATVSLTACQGSNTAQPPTPAASSMSSTPSASPKSQTPTADQSSPKAEGDNTGHAIATKSPVSGAPGACTPEATKIVATEVNRPVNHMLLTVTNKGARACDIYAAPMLRFDDEQAATQTIEESKPQAVATLAPGRSAYAAVRLSSAVGDEAHGYKPRRLRVHFTSRDGSGSVGKPNPLTSRQTPSRTTAPP
ncbi:DUF4232 domain-containing protein [Streptomyces sp. NBC_01167]|uniref:DUF4232 domain-containing protein n=1 Tax=Streptomyces sp. NBC_01167 TaxID=2903756 RepID=UPI00386BA0D2|nr:DUF4232 domain-containing protein [Streptomyces sp. NBC_01167]